MKTSLQARIFTISLTIFAMLFGAGNLMFPLRIGIESGKYTVLGFLGFAITGILLPVIGLMTIVAFEGNYRNYFGRLGDSLGKLFIFFSMLIIGPMIAIPRIITLSYEMLRPFLPAMSELVFAIGFCSLVFLATFRPGKLLDIIGKFLSPLKVLSLIVIVLLGVFSGQLPVPVTTSAVDIFASAFNYGYITLDVLGSIFFGSIIVTLMTKYSTGDDKANTKEAVKVAGIAGICAGLLLGSIYFGMTLLGAFHGYGLGHLNEGAIFSQISFRVLGQYGAALIGATVFLACFTTTVSLSAIVGEYTQVMFGKRLSYAQAVAALLAVCVFVASFGLSAIMKYSIPFVFFFYPLIIVVTLCNFSYKMFGFKYIKAPVIITALVTLPSLVKDIMTLLSA